jgi:leucyl-tRNA synthetase
MIDRNIFTTGIARSVDEYLPTEDGALPLGRATTWVGAPRENKVVSNDDDRDCV